MIRRLFAIVSVASLLLSVAAAGFWISSYFRIVAIQFGWKASLWEIASGDGFIYLDNAPQRRLDAELLGPIEKSRAKQRAEVDALLQRVDQELHPRALKVYMHVHQTKPIGDADAKELQQIQIIKNAILARAAALGYVPSIWEAPFRTHVMNPAVVPNISVLRYADGRPDFRREPPPLPAPATLSRHSISYRMALPIIFLPALLAIVAGGIRRLIANSRIRHQRCWACNYDVRASKDRCPECGTPIADASGLHNRVS